jgi:Bacteriophage lambda head decoration protein D
VQSQWIDEEKRVADFLVSEANLYRSREVITIPEGETVLSPGALLTMAGVPGAAGNVDAILMYPVDPRRGPVQATVIVRDAEVNDAYLIYGDLEREAVNTGLAEHGIIVRPGVLSQSIVTPAQPAAAEAEAQAPPRSSSPRR